MFNTIRIGFYLAYRQIKRSTPWSTVLIIVVMMLTFLNLVVVSGLLVGLIEGSTSAYREKYSGDVFIQSKKEKEFIENSQTLIRIANTIPDVKAVSGRYTEAGMLEANFKEVRRNDELPEQVSTVFAGINPQDEDAVSQLAESIIEGAFLTEDDFDQVVLGSLLLQRYLPFESPNFLTLDDVQIGSKIRATVNGNQREFTVKGVVATKMDEVDRRAFFIDSQLRPMIGRDDFNVDEIVLLLNDHSLASSKKVKDQMLANDTDLYANVQTFEEAQPKFLQDIKDTFTLLGTFLSAIGLVVAIITVFIVIFINAITRRRYIGIMKGIGISGPVIELSYVFQSFFYAVIGSAVGVFLVYVILIPYFAANPINFPFSDGILVAPIGETSFKVAVLILTTMLAGYVPARIIVQKNTLNSILGRK